jgi:toxin HigB-1
MHHRFATRQAERVYYEADYTPGYSREVVAKFRQRVQFIAAADDGRAFYAAKGLHYESLKGQRQHERLMRLNRQFRLVLEIVREQGVRTVIIKGIEDYH